MGTRFEDQPPEHWAGPESLDPTPVWKQYLLVGLFLIGALALVSVIGYLALAPQLATPRALGAGCAGARSARAAGGPAPRTRGRRLLVVAVGRRRVRRGARRPGEP